MHIAPNADDLVIVSDGDQLQSTFTISVGAGHSLSPLAFAIRGRGGAHHLSNFLFQILIKPAIFMFWRPFRKAPCTISLNDHSQMVLRIDSPIDSSLIVDGADRGLQNMNIAGFPIICTNTSQ